MAEEKQVVWFEVRAVRRDKGARVTVKTLKNEKGDPFPSRKIRLEHEKQRLIPVGVDYWETDTQGQINVEIPRMDDGDLFAVEDVETHFKVEKEITLPPYEFEVEKRRLAIEELRKESAAVQAEFDQRKNKADKFTAKESFEATRWKRSKIQIDQEIAKAAPTKLQLRKQELEEKESVHELEKKLQRIEHPSTEQQELDSLHDEYALEEVRKKLSDMRKRLDKLKEGPSEEDKELEGLDKEIKRLEKKAELEEAKARLRIAEEKGKDPGKEPSVIKEVLVDAVGQPGDYRVIVTVIAEKGKPGIRKIQAKEIYGLFPDRDIDTNENGIASFDAKFESFESRYLVTDIESGASKEAKLFGLPKKINI